MEFLRERAVSERLAKTVCTSMLSSVGCCGLHSQLTEALDKSPCYSIPNSVSGLSDQEKRSPLLLSIHGHSEGTVGFFSHIELVRTWVYCR